MIIALELLLSGAQVADWRNDEGNRADRSDAELPGALTWRRLRLTRIQKTRKASRATGKTTSFAAPPDGS